MTLKLGTEIPGTSAEGNITTLWVPTIADIKRPTMAELEAGTDISNYVMLGGWTFEPSQDTVSDQRENSTQDFGAPGRKSAGDISIEVIDNTNTEHAEQNKAVTLMAEGSSGFIVRRRGMATDAPPRRRAEAHRRERQVRREEGPQPGREHHDPKRHPPVRASARLGVRNRRDRGGRGLTRLTIILPCGLSAFLSPHGTPSSPKGRETETRNAPWHWKSSASASRST